ncbi:MAG: DUF4397 domain-containing protein [Ferruginibacter sp.]
MKHINKIIWGLGILSTIAITVSCTREIPQLADTQRDFSNSASVQVFNAVVKSVRNYVYVDGVPVSGTAISSGAVFPATAYSIKLTSGEHSFLIKDTLSTTKQTPITFSQNLEAGKSYTIFTYDTITSVKQLTVLNNIVIPTDTTAQMRFANFIYNTTPVPNVDVYSTKKGLATPIFSNVATNTVTNFIPYPSGITDTFYVYSSGTVSPLLATTKVNSLTRTRSYTTVYSGSFKGTKLLSTFANY